MVLWGKVNIHQVFFFRRQTNLFCCSIPALLPSPRNFIGGHWKRAILWNLTLVIDSGLQLHAQDSAYQQKISLKFILLSFQRLRLFTTPSFFTALHPLTLTSSKFGHFHSVLYCQTTQNQSFPKSFHSQNTPLKSYEMVALNDARGQVLGKSLQLRVIPYPSTTNS